MNRGNSPTRGRPLLLVLTALALPLVVWGATGWGGPAKAPDPVGPQVDPPLGRRALRRQQLLAKIPGDPSALVNVRYEHLPATGEMTLLGKAALPALERGLSHNVKPAVRKRIASVLTDLADHRSASALAAALKDWNAGVRYQAVLGLAAIGDRKAEKVLWKRIDDPEEETYVKRAAIRALGQIGAAGSAKRLLAVLAKTDADRSAERSAALSALWDLRFHLKRAELRRALVLALESEQADLNTFAAAGAAELRDASPRLRRALVKRLRHKNADVRNLAVYALGEIGHRGSIAALRERLPAARSARLLNNIAFALRKMGDTRVMSLLGKLLTHRLAIIRLNAAFVLGDIGDARAIPLLAGALKDPSDYVRASAIAALGRLGSKRASAHLRPLLTSPKLHLRRQALYALNRLTGGGYNDRIARELLWHKHRSIRREAILELAGRKDPRAIGPLLFCYAQGVCGPTDLARGLEAQPSWRATGPLVLSYSRRFGRYGWGTTRLLQAVGKRKLKPGHRSTLRGLLTVGKWRPQLRRPLLRLLGRLQDKTARADYWAFLKSREPLTRLNAAYALANQGYPQGRKHLIVALTQAAPRIKRGAADLLRSVTHPTTRAAILGELRAALRGHGPYTRLAAAYALTGWDAGAGIKILLDTLASRSRRLRNEAAYYLMRKEIRPHRKLIAKAAKGQKRPELRGTMTRILRTITPGTVKTSVFDWVNL